MTSLLIDVSGYIHRAFHALPAMQRPSDGLPTNAINGIMRMFWRLKRDVAGATHFVPVFDAPGRTKRHEIYPSYKAQRAPKPPELTQQLDFVREAVDAFGFPVVELRGYEADDLIAGYAEALSDEGFDVLVVSADKDLMQLIGPGIGQFCPLKDKRLGAADAIEKFGVMPRHIPEAQGLIGDTTDNIPGVKGIGPKGAGTLLASYGSIEGIFDNLHEITAKGVRSKLEAAGRDIALLSRELATLDRSTPLPLPTEALASREIDVDAVLRFSERMEFRSFAADFASHYGVGVPS